MRDALQEAGRSVAYAVLRAPLDVFLARAAGRSSQPPAEPAVAERLWRDFADLGALERHAVDLDDESPDEAASLLEGRIRDGTLRA